MLIFWIGLCQVHLAADFADYADWDDLIVIHLLVFYALKEMHWGTPDNIAAGSPGTDFLDRFMSGPFSRRFR